MMGALWSWRSRRARVGVHVLFAGLLFDAVEFFDGTQHAQRTRVFGRDLL